MTQNKIAVASDGFHDEADAAIRELQPSGFDTKRLRIGVRNYHAVERVVGFHHAGE
ncbi:MAG: hypothetical protein ABIT37_20280 [Luteolibacter sp.]